MIMYPYAGGSRSLTEFLLYRITIHMLKEKTQLTLHHQQAEKEKHRDRGVQYIHGHCAFDLRDAGDSFWLIVCESLVASLYGVSVHINWLTKE